MKTMYFTMVLIVAFVSAHFLGKIATYLEIIAGKL